DAPRTFKRPDAGGRILLHAFRSRRLGIGRAGTGQPPYDRDPDARRGGWAEYRGALQGTKLLRLPFHHSDCATGAKRRASRSRRIFRIASLFGVADAVLAEPAACLYPRQRFASRAALSFRSAGYYG